MVDSKLQSLPLCCPPHFNAECVLCSLSRGILNFEIRFNFSSRPIRGAGGRGHVLDLCRQSRGQSVVVGARAVGRSFALSVGGSVQIDIPCLPHLRRCSYGVAGSAGRINSNKNTELRLRELRASPRACHEIGSIKRLNLNDKMLLFSALYAREEARRGDRSLPPAALF